MVTYQARWQQELEETKQNQQTRGPEYSPPANPLSSLAFSVSMKLAYIVQAFTCPAACH